MRISSATLLSASVIFGLSSLACGKTTAESKTSTAEANSALQTTAASPAGNAEKNGVGSTGAAPVGATAKAEVGKPAPDFTLTDTDGKSFHLADFKGKTVVLEWFNPDCPFVRASHTKGSLKGYANEKVKQGVVWLAINSSAAGKQGHEPEVNTTRKKEWGLNHPILLDGNGEVGHAYGATNTPNMFVIDSKGTLVYSGAIDNSPDGEGESPTSGKLVNYVEQSLTELAANKPVSVASTKAYGCSVKY